eukprot:Platyproteum_vivax@DN4693_c0_g1_i2.p1
MTTATHTTHINVAPQYSASDLFFGPTIETSVLNSEVAFSSATTLNCNSQRDGQSPTQALSPPKTPIDRNSTFPRFPPFGGGNSGPKMLSNPGIRTCSNLHHANHSQRGSDEWVKPVLKTSSTFEEHPRSDMRGRMITTGSKSHG